MITKEKIGKIQFYFGILLLLVTIFGSIYVINVIFLGTYIDGLESLSSTWDFIGQNINGTDIGIGGHVASNLILQSHIIKTAAYLFGACALILVTLSIIMILQGLVNQTNK